MTRRLNGEGTVYKRADGRWEAAVYVLRPDGGRERRSVYGRTRQDVTEKRLALLAQVAAGIPAAATSWTVSAYAEHWLSTAGEHALRPATLSSYRWILKRYVLPEIGKYRLSRLTPAHVRQMLSRLLSTGLSARSAQLAHSVLRSVLSEAVREQVISRNVAALVRGPRVERADVHPWSPAEARQFLAASSEHRLFALFAVGVAVGLRRGELLGLRWEDVDLDVGVLRVRQTVQRLAGLPGLVTGPPKSSRSRRTIPLPEITVATLRRHQEAQSAELVKAGARGADSALVFTSTVGSMLEPRNVSRLFDELQAKADVRRIRFHDLRHTCASMLLAQGVQPRVVMDVLGHSQLSITMDIYGHVMAEALRDAADGMGRALAGE